MFGLFDGDCLIGITAAFALAEDPAAQTAIFGMSFILPEYRGRGLSRLLYEARLEWTRARLPLQAGDPLPCRSLTKRRALRAHRRADGFVLTDTVTLAGLGTEPEEYYEIAV